MKDIIDVALIGAGATMATDVWAAARKRLLGVPALDYALVGRWFAHMPRGRFVHARIAASEAVPGERVLGWMAHYAIGVAFAAVLVGIWGREPAIGPALIVGIGSIAAPFFVMQPGFGLGVAASRTARPAAARLQALITHTVFGLGLYAAGLLTEVLRAYI